MYRQGDFENEGVVYDSPLLFFGPISPFESGLGQELNRC